MVGGLFEIRIFTTGRPDYLAKQPSISRPMHSRSETGQVFAGSGLRPRLILHRVLRAVRFANLPYDM
jgi:hypothetical protein